MIKTLTHLFRYMYCSIHVEIIFLHFNQLDDYKKIPISPYRIAEEKCLSKKKNLF